MSSPERKNILHDPEFIKLHQELLKLEEIWFNTLWPRIESYLQTLTDEKEQKKKAYQLICELEGISVQSMGDGRSSAAGALQKRILFTTFPQYPKLFFVPFEHFVSHEDARLLRTLCPELFL